MRQWRGAARTCATAEVHSVEQGQESLALRRSFLQLPTSTCASARTLPHAEVRSGLLSTSCTRVHAGLTGTAHV